MTLADRVRPSLSFDVVRQRRRFGLTSTIHSMQGATGTIVNGKIVLEDVVLDEGVVVAVVTRGADERFSLTEAQEEELAEALAEIERGEFVTFEGLLRPLPGNG